MNDVNRARDLATASLEFGGADAVGRKAHLVLGLIDVLHGLPTRAELHWQKAEEGSFLRALKRAKISGQPISWPEILEEAGLYSLALKQLDNFPDRQFAKIEAFLSDHWDSSFWELTKGNSNHSVFYRLILKQGIKPADLELLRGWPIHHLVLCDIPIADLGRLSDFPELRILELREGHLAKDLSPLVELRKLTSLSLTNHADSPDYTYDLTPLASLTRLHQLDIGANVISLSPLRDLDLTKLRTGRLVNNSSLLPLQGMLLESIEVENPFGFDGLLGMPLHRFRPGFTETGYSIQEIKILNKLPISHLRFNGNFGKEFLLLTKSPVLEALETDFLHDFSIWENTSLTSLHIKGNDHDFYGIAETPIKELTISAHDSPISTVVLYPLLRASQLSRVTITNAHDISHIHMETPTLSASLIKEDWSSARAEFARLKHRYLKHSALKEIAESWLPVLETHIRLAEAGEQSRSWHPAREFEGHTYQWFRTPMTLEAAQDMAKLLGGHLVSVESEDEWEFLEQDFGLPSQAGIDGLSSSQIWIGSTSPGSARTVSVPAVRNRNGEAPSVYMSQGDLVLLPTDPDSTWSFIIEWDEPGNETDLIPEGGSDEI